MAAALGLALIILAGAVYGLTRRGGTYRPALTLPQTDRPAVRVHLKWLPEAGEIAVTEDIALTNRESADWDFLCLRFHAGAYTSAEASPAAADDLSAYPDGFEAARVRLDGCWVDGTLTELTWDSGQPALLRVSTPLAAGQTAKLTLRLTLTLPRCIHLLGRDDAAVRLIQTLPVSALRLGGRWDDAPAAPYAAPQDTDWTDFTVTADLPEGWTLVTGALTAANQLNILLVPADMPIARGKVNGTAVTVRADSPARAGAILKAVEDALSVCGRHYGALPDGTLHVVSLPYTDTGLSAPGLVLLDSRLGESALPDAAAYWTAGQWFGWVLGSDSFRESWLACACRQWAALRVIRETRGADEEARVRRLQVELPMRENLHAAVTPGMPADSFPSQSVFRAVMDGRATALLYAIDEMTNGRMDAILADLTARSAFRRITRNDLAQAILTASGHDALPLMTDWLDTYMNENPA